MRQDDRTAPTLFLLEQCPAQRRRYKNAREFRRPALQPSHEILAIRDNRRFGSICRLRVHGVGGTTCGASGDLEGILGMFRTILTGSLHRQGASMFLR